MHLKEEPLVTVAMVTYNSEKYVTMAIKSILASSYTNFELIIFDDNSRDETWERIKAFHDPRIFAYRNDKNVGEYNNRNNCIEYSKGKYLIFIDGDDMIYPYGLEYMLKQIECFEECSMAMMTWYRSKFFYPIIVDPTEFFQSHYFGDSFLGTAFTSVLFKTKVLKESGGLPNYYPNGDDFIRLKIGMKHKILMLNDGLAWWRETSGQASATHRQNIQSILKSFKMNVELLEDLNCPLNAEEKIKAKFNLKKEIVAFSLNMAKNGNYKMFLGLLEGCGVSFYQLPYYYFKPKFKFDPFERYSADHPLMIPFEENPLIRNGKLFS